jgi:hypothetical protein
MFYIALGVVVVFVVTMAYVVANSKKHQPHH